MDLLAGWPVDWMLTGSYSFTGHWKRSSARQPYAAEKCSPTLRPNPTDMVRLVASLERLPVEFRSEVAEWLSNRLENPGNGNQLVGVGPTCFAQSVSWQQARHHPTPQGHPWLKQMLREDWRKNTSAAFAAVMISRPSEDRDEDIGAELREVVLGALKMLNTRELESARD